MAEAMGTISRNGDGNVDRGKVSKEAAIRPRKIPPMIATSLSAGIAIKLFRVLRTGRMVKIGVRISPVRKPSRPKTIT